MEESNTSLEFKEFKQSEKWAHRPYKQPINYDDAARAVEIVLTEYDRIGEFDPLAEQEYQYDQEHAKLLGVWLVGSMAAGRWTRESDVDVWIQIKGLSDNGYDNLDWHVKENLQERGETVTTEDGMKREIDVLIFDYPPDPEYAVVRLSLL